MPFLCKVSSEQITVTMSLSKARHQPNLCNVRTTPPTQDEECSYSAEEFEHPIYKYELPIYKYELWIYKYELWIYKRSNKFINTNFVFTNTGIHS